MGFQLYKIIPYILLSPLLWSFLCDLVAIFFLRRSQKKSAIAWICLSFLAILIPSTPLVVRPMVAHLESFAPARPFEEYPEADAIVVLGGSVVRLIPPRVTAEEVRGNRVYVGFQLFRLGKAKTIIVSGGLPYVAADGSTRTESTDMREILTTMGVPPAAIIEESTSRTTQENAEHVAAMLPTLGVKKVLLVTSALHLRRAAAQFAKSGVAFVPVPAQHELGRNEFFLEQLPTPRHLSLFCDALREYVGYLAIR